MKQQLSRRELSILSASVVLIIATGLYGLKMHQDLSKERRLNAANMALLSEKDVDTNKTANYIESICAEYRKLYQSDRQLRYPGQTNIDKYIGLPGSASGQIDKCYLPE